jgi:hypothetical protein
MRLDACRYSGAVVPVQRRSPRPRGSIRWGTCLCIGCQQTRLSNPIIADDDTLDDDTLGHLYSGLLLAVRGMGDWRTGGVDQVQPTNPKPQTQPPPIDSSTEAKDKNEELRRFREDWKHTVLMSSSTVRREGRSLVHLSFGCQGCLHKLCLLRACAIKNVSN